MAFLPEITAPPCPACPEGRGAATALSIRDHTRSLHFRCLACSHEWERTFGDAEWQKALGVDENGVGIYPILTTSATPPA